MKVTRLLLKLDRNDACALIGVLLVLAVLWDIDWRFAAAGAGLMLVGVAVAGEKAKG